MAIKLLAPIGKNVIGKVEKESNVEVKDLSDLNKLKIPPPRIAPKTKAQDERPTGFVLEHAFDKQQNLEFTKVVTQFKGKYKTLLLFRPNIKLPIGAEIGFEYTDHNGRPCLKDAYLINDESVVKTFINYITSDDVISDTNIGEVYLSNLVEEFLAEGSPKTKPFLDSQNIHSIVGVVGNRLIVRWKK